MNYLKQSFKRRAAGVTRLFATRKAGTSVILNYHSVHPGHTNSVKPDPFRRQMEYLASAFDVISLKDFFEMRAANAGITKRYAVITFDDGYDDNYVYAYPVLKTLGIKATIFLATGFINRETDIAKRDGTYAGLSPLTWEQIREMDGNSMEFGAHTHSHPILSRISPQDVEKEIVTSRRIIEDKIGKPVKTFAYPNGQRKTFNTSNIEILKKHGFILACSTIWGSDNRATNLFSLRRIRVDACDTLDDFKEKVNGSWDFIRFIQNMR